MFARVVVCQSKAGRSQQVGNKIGNEALPILQKQPGFVDFLTLSDKTDPERLVCISFWTLREDFERYNREHYYTIADTLQPLLESHVTQETFEVNASTAHGIAVGKAT
jgi:heme-degrading monooxygenase HmoA